MNNSMIVAVRLILGGGGRELPNDFPNHLQSFYSFTSSMRIPVSPHPQQHSFLSFFYFSHFCGCEVMSHGFGWHFLVTADVEQLALRLLAICISSGRHDFKFLLNFCSPDLALYCLSLKW